MELKRFEHQDYERVIDFLIKLNKDNKEHINWNWARFEWMYEHPMFDKTLMSRIGLWINNGEVIGAAIYDMFLGEASVLVLPEYHDLYQEILDFAYENIKDDEGLKVAVNDNSHEEIKILLENGFLPIEQSETIMRIDLDNYYEINHQEGVRFTYLDPLKDYEELCWLFYQGFDNGNDREECKKINPPEGASRPHFNPHLAITMQCDDKYVGHCSLWYNDKTDYAYLEPLCVIPEYRHRGIAKMMIYEALNRVKELGAKKVYVISDIEFYERIGFKRMNHYTFYQKR